MTADRLGPQFGRYWTAAAISSYGTAVTAVALPILVVQQLGASALETALVNAAQLVPYALFGLVAGAYVDRWPRKPVLVWSSVGRALSIGAIPLMALLGRLEIWMLVVALLAFGTCSVFGFAATQSLLPRLVERRHLVRANARLDQTDATSLTLGPALGGALVKLVGAPGALLIDAVSYVVDAVLIAGLRVDERPRTDADAPPRQHLGREIREGLGFTYRHPLLGRLALSTHVWFVANGAAVTTLQLLALRTLGLGEGAFAALVTVLGIATLLGASLAPLAGRRLGAGGAVLLARALYPVAWLVLALGLGTSAGGVLVFGTQALLGLAAGVENANEMALWQSRTPDALLGRVNGARRSVNRTLGAVGAVLAGVLITIAGHGAALVLIVTAYAVAALLVGQRAVRSSQADAAS